MKKEKQERSRNLDSVLPQVARVISICLDG